MIYYVPISFKNYWKGLPVVQRKISISPFILKSASVNYGFLLWRDECFISLYFLSCTNLSRMTILRFFSLNLTSTGIFGVNFVIFSIFSKWFRTVKSSKPSRSLLQLHSIRFKSNNHISTFMRIIVIKCMVCNAFICSVYMSVIWRKIA